VGRSSNRQNDRTSSRPEWLITIAAGSGTFRSQIENAVRHAVRSGRFSSNSPLPSSRALARDLGVSRGVVVAAYEQLIAEGFLVARPGGRTIAAPKVTAADVAVERPSAPELQDFKPGTPDVREFPHADWMRATKKALKAVTDRELGYGDARGTSVLRSALAAYLGRARAVDTSPGQILICAGVTQALGIAARAFAASGIRCIAVEDPAQPDVRRLLTEAGAKVVAVPVDREGLVVAELARTSAGAVIVTPAHQFPVGCVLSPQRRHELIAWARARRGFIVEDDYDAEYRYDGSAVGAIQGLAPDRVVYTGSASKTLAPGLRIGWLCLPPPLLESAIVAKQLADHGSPSIEQLVYADFISAGALDRHLRRMRRLYRTRRDTLVGFLAQRTPWTVEGISAGLHLVATVRSATEESKVVKKAHTRGVVLHPMSEYRRERPRLMEHALVFGYGQFTETEIERGLRRVLD
jgi:GntR family transcriptional regulator/MocR family aminotransferase